VFKLVGIAFIDAIMAGKAVTSAQEQQEVLTDVGIGAGCGVNQGGSIRIQDRRLETATPSDGLQAQIYHDIRCKPLSSCNVFQGKIFPQRRGWTGLILVYI
jgi:hypothetical protein